MTEFLQFDQDGAIVALFVGILVCCVGTAAVVAILRVSVKWGAVALCLGAAAVCIALMGRCLQ